jgi:hypothetical protein
MFQYQHLSSLVLRSNNLKIEMHLFIQYNLQLEIINFLCKNLRKAECYAQSTSYENVTLLLTFL